MVLAGLAMLGWQTRLPAQNAADPIRGYQVTPELGPWMISTQYYTGPEAKELACQLANELRTTYRLPAHIFNYVEEERKLEQERVRKEKERLRELLRRQEEYLKGMEHAPGPPIHVWTRRFEDQCVVLIGGYRDEATARRELDRLKKLKPPDPKKVRLGVTWIQRPKSERAEATYVSPFAQSFVVHNPAVKQAPQVAQAKPDPMLPRLNAEEEFSLLKCPKRFTLAVALFRGASTVVSDLNKGKKENGSFLDRLGQGGEPGQALCAAAWNAHEVAKVLKQLKLEVYVLHAPYYSLVTVGSFDRLDEPALQATQRDLAQLKPSLQKVPMLPEPMPIAIPHP
jgi:hypothetical protein